MRVQRTWCSSPTAQRCHARTATRTTIIFWFSRNEIGLLFVNDHENKSNDKTAWKQKKLEIIAGDMNVCVRSYVIFLASFVEQQKAWVTCLSPFLLLEPSGDDVDDNDSKTNCRTIEENRLHDNYTRTWKSPRNIFERSRCGTHAANGEDYVI